MSTIPDQDRINQEQIVAEGAGFPPKDAEHGLIDMSAITLHMVGHAHMDIGYRWDFKETVFRMAPWTFRGVLDLMERTPGFTFCQSQLFLYQTMEREYPELFARICSMIQKGTWEVIGGSWCEYDAVMPSGESVIRQHLVAVRYAVDSLGVTEHKVAFVPDSFCGHAATLPQILSGCGFEYYVFGRGLPKDEDVPEKTKRGFQWIGPDGSSLIAYFLFGPYSTPPITKEYLATYKPYIETSVSNQEMVLYGTGDHGGGPRDAEINALRALKSIHEAPQWRFSTIHEYCREAFDQSTRKELRTYCGNLGFGKGVATGALISQARIKRRNRQLERELLFAESTTVIGTILSRKPAFPRVDFQLLWQEFLSQQFHDILPGTSIHSVYREDSKVYDRIEERCSHLIEDNFCRIRSRIDTRLEGYPLVVYNPGLQPVKTVVDVDCPSWLNIEHDDSKWKLVTTEGKETEFQLGNNKLTFMADLPSLGCRTLCLIQGKSSQRSRSAVRFKNNTIESPLFRITFNMKNGNLAKIYDKRNKRQLLDEESNCLDLLEEIEISTAWVQAFTGEKIQLYLVNKPHIVESNRFFVRIATVSKSRLSIFTREVTVYHEIERIDFRISADWHESNAGLNIGFVPALSNPVVKAALAHGSAVIKEPHYEFCMHDWVDINDGKCGIAFLNDGTYGCRFEQGRLGISVMRTARDMDPAMDYGKHELRYSLVPYDGKSLDSRFVHESGNLCHKPLCAFEPSHPGALATWGVVDNSQPLPPEHCFIKVDKPNVVICAFKMPEEQFLPQAFVIRLREVDGVSTECLLTLPLTPSSVVESDHLERPKETTYSFNDRNVQIPLRPHEIKTIIAYV